jgi:TonB C terminal
MRVRPRRQWWASAGAVILAIAAHLLMVAAFIPGGAAHKRPPPPDQPGAGASALASSTLMPEAMTLVQLLHTETSDSEPLEELASLGIALPHSALVIASPDPTPPPVLDEEAIEDAESTEAAGDTHGHAEMFGRYLGQISARIERAWRRPRSAIGASRFSCQTKIEQDERGKVLSVELRYCNGDVRWKHSLVSAIERASPLPAPPIPSVFARWLTLNFSAESWQAGLSNAHDYEPEIRLAVSSEASPRQLVTNPDKALADVARYQGHIELRIEGDMILWTLSDGPPRVVEEQGANDERARGRAR